MKYLLIILFTGLGAGWLANNAWAQAAVIVLDSCGVSYIDPQDAHTNTAQTRDTLRYTTFFQDAPQLRAFYVDINAFGGQQTDRGTVFALLPGNRRRVLGALAFGGCPDCTEGFALLVDNELVVSGVSDRTAMDRWLQGYNQPPFALPGNLQTLAGAGRISGRIPFCAIGFEVEFIVNSNPASTSTEFSTHILCPVPIADCTIGKEARIDCQRDSIFLRATLPPDCFPPGAQVRWITPRGAFIDGSEGAVPLSDNQGWYYLSIDDGDCQLLDSLLVESPGFADAGPDLSACLGEAVTLAGRGGRQHSWTLPSGSVMGDSLLVLTNLQPDDEGTYILRAVNADGCADTDTLRLTVRRPADPGIEVSAACLGDTIRLTARNAAAFVRQQWLDPAGAPLDPPLIPDFQAADAGDYTFVGADTAGCEVRLTVPVSGSEPPDFAIDIEQSCDSSRVYLSPDTYRYAWSTGESGPRLATATGGDYQLTVTDAAGCATVTAIAVPRPDAPEVGLDITHPFCPNDPGAIEIIPANPDRPVIFSIDGGATYSLSARFTGLPPGSYPIAVQDEFGCVRQLTAVINVPDTLGVSLGIERLDVRPNTPVTLTAKTVGNAQIYQWVPEEINTQGPATSFIANRNMDVRIIVQDSRGCHASDGFPLTIVLGDIYVPNAFSPNGDGLNDRFTFYSDNGSGEIIERLQIYNRWGDLVFEADEIPLNDEAFGWNGVFRGRPVAPGVLAYYGVVRFGNGQRKAYKGDVTLLR